jgi:hypothetical protein
MYILILIFHLRLDIPNGAFSSVFSAKVVHAFINYLVRTTCLSHLTLHDLINFIWWRALNMKLIVQICPASCCFLPVRSKYSQHPVLKHSVPLQASGLLILQDLLIAGTSLHNLRRQSLGGIIFASVVEKMPPSNSSWPRRNRIGYLSIMCIVKEMSLPKC